MNISRKITAGLIAAGIAFSGTAVANAQSSLTSLSSSGSNGASFEVLNPRTTPESVEADVKQMYVDKGYTLIEAPELLDEYAGKAQNSREVTYLPNGNGIFGDSFGHILDGYFPKVSRLKHFDYNLRIDPSTSIVTPAAEGERAAIDLVSDDTYYYIVIITFTDLYQG